MYNIAGNMHTETTMPFCRRKKISIFKESEKENKNKHSKFSSQIRIVFEKEINKNKHSRLSSQIRTVSEKETNKNKDSKFS